jgi:hypothetical protein
MTRMKKIPMTFDGAERVTQVTYLILSLSQCIFISLSLAVIFLFWSGLHR